MKTLVFTLHNGTMLYLGMVSSHTHRLPSSTMSGSFSYMYVINSSKVGNTSEYVLQSEKTGKLYSIDVLSRHLTEISTKILSARGSH